MIAELKKWFSSRTIKAAGIIAALGVVEMNFHMLQDLLGEYYGISFIVFSAAMAYYRSITTGPLK